jgi:single-strand DNA-binding protein
MKSLNSVQLIGNLAREPDLRKMPNGVSVCNFWIITNREWKTKDGEERSDSIKHTCVAWGRLAEICGELLRTGNLVFVSGYLSQRQQRRDTEWRGVNRNQEVAETIIVVEDMISFGERERKYEKLRPSYR